MTKLETAIDIQYEVKICREEYPEEGKFKRWDEFMEEVVEALKGGLKHGRRSTSASH